MEQDILTNLPQEIAIDIFSRLPIPTIGKCKCVCKLWRHLLSTPEFVDYHYSKSLPGLILSKESGKETSRQYKILEFVDSCRRPCKTVCDFSVPHSAILHSLANGLLLFFKYENRNMLVCNPLTHEYIDLPPPTQSPRWYHNYGFGVSKVSGEYKVVRISIYGRSYKFKVYTLGTGSWRNVIVPAGGVALPRHHPCVFVDGKLYSWVKELRMSCFDLEIEVFSTVYCPPSPDPDDTVEDPQLCALGDRLCFCLNNYDDFVIWVMHEVGEWRKEFVICGETKMEYRYYCFLAIKVLGEGKLLLVIEEEGQLYYYSRKRKRETLKPTAVTSHKSYVYRVGYTPSFLSLKNFALENVCSS